MTEVTLIDTECFMEESCFAGTLCDISQKRREKAAGYRFAKDRALSVGAAVLLDRALSKYGLREKDMTYLTEENGKPCFPGHKPFHFSISHSGTKAALTVSDYPVGCDIQIVKKADLRVAERCFTPGEVSYLKDAADDKEQDLRFFRIWALRESFSKALGVGLGRPMTSYAVLDENGRAQCPAAFEIPYVFMEYHVHGYVLCVCAPQTEQPELIHS